MLRYVGPCILATTTALFVLANRAGLFASVTEGVKLDRREIPERSKLPRTLKDWRGLFCENLENHQIRVYWQLLYEFFADKHGIILWDNIGDVHQYPPSEADFYPQPNGFNFLAPDLNKSLTRWARFTLNSGAQHAARTKDGCDVVIRVMTSGGNGDNHLRIQRHLNSKKPDILLSSNHILPMIGEVVFEDITFGIFPRLDTNLRFAFITRIWGNSVEDILYMIMEALEGIKYLHENRIAHQDMFVQNFMIEWQPESLLKRNSRRPRVFIIDFEDAVMFPEGTPPEEMKVPRFPRVLSECGRELPPEVHLSKPYCPFMADMWQFGEGLRSFQTGCEEVTQIFANMVHDAPEDRLTADQAYDQLDDFLRAHPLSTLHRTFPWF